MNETPAMRLQSQLRRMSGAVNIKQVISDHGATMQFTLGFPQGRLVDFRRERSTGIGDSVITISDDGKVTEALIRLPPVPNETYTPTQVDSTVARLLGRTTDIGATYKIVDETRAIWPHIEFRAGIGADPVPRETFMSWFESLFDSYQTQYWSADDAI